MRRHYLARIVPDNRGPRLLASGTKYRRAAESVLIASRGTTRQLWLWSRRGSCHNDTPGTIYQQLNSSKHEIRVLRIQPGTKNTDLSCALETVSLDWSPSYDTLSYTWGTSHTTLPIEVNGTTVQISPSLFEALKALRQPRKTVTLWADALCIDQSNVAEKNAQVAMMDLIYRGGRQTWVSLGSPDKEWAIGTWKPGPKIEGSMHIIKRIVRGTWRLFWHHIVLRRSRASRLGANHVSDSVRLLKSLEAKGELSSQNLGDRNIAHSMLAWLITHHYWERVWILQEVALSSKDPICIFGKHQIPLLSLDTVLRDWRGGWDGKDSSRHVIRGWLPEFTRGFDRIVEVCLLRDEYRRKRQLDPIRSLQLTSHRYTSLAHDHVYGLFSLLVPSLQAVAPDYGLPVRELFSLVTKDILQERKTADILCAAVGIGSVNKHNLPSWAHDFSAPVAFPAKRDVESSDTFDHIFGTNAGILPLAARPLEDQVISVMNRKLIDWATFEKLGLTDANRDVTPAAERVIDDIVSQCYHTATQAGLQPDLRAFMEIMTSKVYETDTDNRFEHQQEDALHRRLQEREQQTQSPQDAEITKQQMPLAMLQMLSSFFAQEMGLRARNHNFFRTRQGRIGKCAGEVAVGDELWSLSNSEIHFLIRSAGEEVVTDKSEQRRPQYSLVGPCKCSDAAVDSSSQQPPARQIELT